MKGGRSQLLRFLRPDLRVRIRIRFPIPLWPTLRRPVLPSWPRPRRPYAQPAVSFLSDARPTEEIRLAGPIDPELVRRIRLRLGTIVTALVLVFAIGVALSIFGSRGWRDVQASRNELETMKEQVQLEEAKVLVLKHQVQRLKEDPTAIERIAREDLGYAKPGEVTFLLEREAGEVGGSAEGKSAEGGP